MRDWTDLSENELLDEARAILADDFELRCELNRVGESAITDRLGLDPGHVLAEAIIHAFLNQM